MDKVIDFTYKQLRAAIIESYTSGDFDNNLNQLQLSLKYLDAHYNQKDFRDLNNLHAAKKRLLFKVQADVDHELGRSIYSLGE